MEEINLSGLRTGCNEQPPQWNERGLCNVPRRTPVVLCEKMPEDIKGLVKELKSAVEEYERLVSETKTNIEKAEEARYAAEKVRAKAEELRIAAEEERAASEAARQSAYALIESTLNAAESDRIAAETLRQAAEALRQSTFETNEAARADAHASQMQSQATAHTTQMESQATAYTNAEANRNGAYQEAEEDRDEIFNRKEATRDAANEAALNCADALAALGPEISKINGETDLTEQFSFTKDKLIRASNGEYTGTSADFSANQNFINIEEYKRVKITVPVSKAETSSGMAFYDAEIGSSSHIVGGRPNSVDTTLTENSFEVVTLDIPSGAKYMRATWVGVNNSNYAKFKCVGIKDTLYDRVNEQESRIDEHDSKITQLEELSESAASKVNAIDLRTKVEKYDNEAYYLNTEDWEFTNVDNHGNFIENQTERPSQQVYISGVSQIVLIDTYYTWWVRCFDVDGTFLGSFNANGYVVGVSTGAATTNPFVVSAALQKFPTLSYVYIVLKLPSTPWGIVHDNVVQIQGRTIVETTLKLGLKPRFYVRNTFELPMEYGGLANSGKMETVAASSTFFTKKRTKNYIMIESFSLTLYDCTAEIFLYTSGFELYQKVAYSSNFDAMEYLPYCAYFKIVITPSADSAKAEISISEYNEVKNEYGGESAISFLYQVVPCGGRDLSAADVLDETQSEYTSQLETTKHYNSGMLRLPPNYKSKGTPTKLILWAHGSGWYGRIDFSEFNTSYLPYIQYLQKEGYAIFDCYGMSSKYYHGTTTANALGSPTNMICIFEAYRWVLEHYNIDPNGIYVASKSLGGIIAANMLFQNTIPVRACCPLAPELDARGIQLGYAEQARIDYCDDMGFSGADVVIGTSQSNPMATEVYRQLLSANKNLMCGYVAPLCGVISPSIEDLVQYSSSNSVYATVRRVCKVPVKIFIAADDSAVSYNASKYFVQSIKETGGIAELRTMPSNTGGHHAVDYGDDANNKPSIKVDVTTELGYECEDVPLAWAEMVQFFRRF